MRTIEQTFHLAIQLHQQGEWVQAEMLLNQILETNPQHAEALHTLGIIAYQRGEISLGIQLIQQAIASQPAVALFHSNLAEMQRKLKAFSLSIQSGQRAIELDPNSATAWSNLGITHYDLEQYSDAETCHRRALSLHPTLSSSLNNMGSIYKKYGDLKQAMTFYQQALSASPNFIEPLNNLGVVFLQQQAYTLAFKYFNQVIFLMPGFAQAHCNLGAAFLGLDQVDQAKACFEKTLQLNPDFAEAYGGLAKVYLYKQDFIQAEHHIRKAIMLDGQHAEFYQILAMIFQEQGDHQQALAYLNQALCIDSNFASAYLAKGNVFMEMGDIAQAEAQFLNAAQDPLIDHRVCAQYSLVQLRKIKSDSPSLKALLSLENMIDQIPAHRLEYIYFALGKCFDDLGEWSKAFTYFDQGCRLKRQRISYHIAEQIQFTQKIIHCFTQESIEYLRTFAHSSTVPIFIVGMPRSGSTLVEQILSSHPRVHGAGELKYLNDLIQWPVKTGEVILNYPENILKLSPDIYPVMTQKYLDYLQNFSSHATHVTDKMLHNFTAIGFIHALFPHAKIIHVQRNPIDTCLSCYTKLFSQGQLYSYDLKELGQYYNSYAQIMNHWRHILPPHAWLDIAYENIVCDLEKEAQRLLAFCNLAWDPKCLDFYQSKRHVKTASFAQVRQPLYTTSVDRWRRFEKALTPLIQTLELEAIL